MPPIDIPAEIQIRATIREGSVYYFPEESFTSQEPHYFVVLNHHPGQDDAIILACATKLSSKALQRRAGLPPETLVQVTPQDCPFLKRASVFDCNRPLEKPIEVLIEKRKNKQLKFKGEISKKVLEKLRGGVLSSPLVTQKCKKRLAK